MSHTNKYVKPFFDFAIHHYSTLCLLVHAFDEVNKHLVCANGTQTPPKCISPDGIECCFEVDKVPVYWYSSLLCLFSDLPDYEYSICGASGTSKAALFLRKMVVDGDLDTGKNHSAEHFPWNRQQGDCSVIGWVQLVTLLEDRRDEAFAPILWGFALRPSSIDDF